MRLSTAQVLALHTITAYGSSQSTSTRSNYCYLTTTIIYGDPGTWISYLGFTSSSLPLCSSLTTSKLTTTGHIISTTINPTPSASTLQATSTSTTLVNSTTESPSTLHTDSVVSGTTSASSTSLIGPPPPTSTPFVIQVDVPNPTKLKLHKRDISYIAFLEGVAYLTSYEDHAAVFVLTATSYLLTEGSYVEPYYDQNGAVGTNPLSLPGPVYLQQTWILSPNRYGWSIDGGSLILGNASFYIDDIGRVLLFFGGAGVLPNGVMQANLAVDYVEAATSSSSALVSSVGSPSSSWSSTISTSSMTTTTWATSQEPEDAISTSRTTTTEQEASGAATVTPMSTGTGTGSTATMTTEEWNSMTSNTPGPPTSSNRSPSSTTSSGVPMVSSSTQTTSTSFPVPARSTQMNSHGLSLSSAPPSNSPGLPSELSLWPTSTLSWSPNILTSTIATSTSSGSTSAGGSSMSSMTSSEFLNPHTSTWTTSPSSVASSSATLGSSATSVPGTSSKLISTMTTGRESTLAWSTTPTHSYMPPTSVTGSVSSTSSTSTTTTTTTSWHSASMVVGSSTTSTTATTTATTNIVERSSTEPGLETPTTTTTTAAATTSGTTSTSFPASTTSSTPTAIPYPSKRGLAYTNVTTLTFYPPPQPYISWSYNYFSLPNASDNIGPYPSSQFHFIPLLYNDDPSLTSIWHDNVDFSVANYGTDAIFGFNEPDACYSGMSACMPVNLSVQGYIDHMQPFAERSPQVKIGSVSVTNAGGGLAYLSQFLGNATALELTIDFINIHWYASPYNIDYFKEYLTEAYTVTGEGNYPVWVTEFGMDRSDYDINMVQAFLKNATSWMDETEWVERYAWFGNFKSEGGTGMLLNDDGSGIGPLGRIWSTCNGTEYTAEGF